MSDKGAKGERTDASGSFIQEFMEKRGFKVIFYEVISDDLEIIVEKLAQVCDEMHPDLILTSGGTGFSARDNTPEATLEVVNKIVPGIPEAIRYYGLQITPQAMLSRAVAGIRGKTLIVNLPGSVKGVRESLEPILKPLLHGLDILKANSSECGQE